FDGVSVFDGLPRRLAEPAVDAAVEQAEGEEEEQQRRQQRQPDAVGDQPRLELRRQTLGAALAHQFDDVAQQDEEHRDEGEEVERREPVKQQRFGGGVGRDEGLEVEPRLRDERQHQQQDGDRQEDERQLAPSVPLRI